MTLGKIFGILIFSSLVATGPTLTGDISKNLAKSKNLANSKRVANVTASVIHHVGHADRHGAQHRIASQNQAASPEG
jgi:hypothetical protein